MERLLHSLAPGIDIHRQAEMMSSEGGRGDDDAEEHSPAADGPTTGRIYSDVLEAFPPDAARSSEQSFFLNADDKGNVEEVAEDFAGMAFEEGRCVFPILANDAVTALIPLIKKDIWERAVGSVSPAPSLNIARLRAPTPV
jgi:hypothetical protein